VLSFYSLESSSDSVQSDPFQGWPKNPHIGLVFYKSFLTCNRVERPLASRHLGVALELIVERLERGRKVAMVGQSVCPQTTSTKNRNHTQSCARPPHCHILEVLRQPTRLSTQTCIPRSSHLGL